MTYRNLESLINTEQLSNFLSEFELSCSYSENSLWIYNNEMALRVYGLEVEDFLYMEVISLEDRKCGSLSSVIEVIPPCERNAVLTEFMESIKEPHLTFLHPHGKSNAIKAEVYFRTYLELIRKFLPEMIANGFRGVSQLKDCDSNLIRSYELMLEKRNS